MARRHLEQSLTLYNPTQYRSPAFLYGQDHGVACLSYAAWVLWLLGYPDQALQRSQEALSLAQELSHPFSLAFALNFAALLRLYRREGQAAQAQAETLITLSVEQGFALYCAHGTILRGGALAVQGQGSGFTVPVASPQPLTLNPQVEVEAEACFLKALEVARHQQAKSWELRAAISLGRLWQRQARRAEARQLLAAVYGWFTEGFDTADLQEAKGLLEELA